MTPDRMVVAEAMRTFTYLSLYGYLTDAVVVNRVFPDELDGTYFGAWRDVQQRELDRVREGFSPVPVRTAPYFEAEVRRPRDARPARRGAVRGRRRGRAPARGLAQDFAMEDGRGELRLAVPFAGKGDVSLKKVGDELVVRVDDRKRTVVLPPALAALKPTGAALDGGALVVRFA